MLQIRPAARHGSKSGWWFPVHIQLLRRCRYQYECDAYQLAWFHRTILASKSFQYNTNFLFGRIMASCSSTNISNGFVSASFLCHHRFLFRLTMSQNCLLGNQLHCPTGADGAQDLPASVSFIFAIKSSIQDLCSYRTLPAKHHESGWIPLANSNNTYFFLALWSTRALISGALFTRSRFVVV